MSLTVTNPSYDRVYPMYAWRDNNIRLVLTQGEGATTLDGTVARIKAPRFQLRDDQGVISLSGSPVVSLALTRPDKSEDLLACTIIDAANGIVSCPITASATNVAGLASGEICIYSNNSVIKFYGVHAIIYKGTSNSAAAQSTQFSDLVSALQKVAVIDPSGSNTIMIDDAIVENGTNPVASGVIYDYLVDNYYTKTQSDNRYYQKSQVYTKEEADASATDIIDTILLNEHESAAGLDLSNGELIYVATDGTVVSLGDAKNIFYTKTQMNTFLAAKANSTTTLAGYGITDGMKYIEASSNGSSIPAVDSCTDSDTIYKVWVASGVVSSAYMTVICVHSETKLIQYAFSRSGHIIFRSATASNNVISGAWSDWEYLPPMSDVSSAISSAVLNSVLRHYKDITPSKSYVIENDDATSYLSQSAYSDYGTSGAYSNTNVPGTLANRADRPNSTTVSIPTGGTKIVFTDTNSGNEWSENVSGSTHTIINLIPYRLYLYNIINNSGDVIKSGSVRATGKVRMINGGGDTFNIRDLGGWDCDGGKMKYGIVYRGCRLNGGRSSGAGNETTDIPISLTGTQVDYFKNVLGIRDEIDLRSDNGASGITDTALGIGVDYIRYPIDYYQNSLSNTKYYSRIIKRLAQNIRDGKVTYIHCASGADRTAQACMFIEAICGMSQSDIDRDYELTSFAFETNNSRLTRTRNASTTADWKQFIAGIEEYSGSTFRDRAIDYLVKAGVPMADINAIRYGLIDGEPQKITSAYANATITTNLTNVKASNTDKSVELYQPYENILFSGDMYAVKNVTLTVGGVDKTSDYYEAGKIYIPSVTGNIVITATGICVGNLVTSVSILSSGWNNGTYTLDSSMPTGTPYNTKVDVAFGESAYNQLISDGCTGLYVSTDTSNTPHFVLHAMGNTPTANITVQLVLQQLADV